VVFHGFRPISFYRRLKRFILLIGMCLAIPAKVMSLNGDKASVDFGQGVLREVNVSLVEAKLGDYVLVHAGYAIQIIEEKEAQETLNLWNSILEAGQE
jgi:hydrogenase expression/formation protein HypC